MVGSLTTYGNFVITGRYNMFFSYLFKKQNIENEADKETLEISKRLVDFVLSFLMNKNGQVSAENAVALMCTIIGERCIEATGDYSIYDHNNPPGHVAFSDNINKLLYGNSETEKIYECPKETVFGLLWYLLNDTAYSYEDSLSITRLRESFNANIVKAEDWIKCPWSVPAEHMPSIVPLITGYQTRNRIDYILQQIPNKIDKLSTCIHALIELLVMLKDTIDQRTLLLIAFETIYGMARTAPMTGKAMIEWKRNLRMHKLKCTNTENRYENACNEYSSIIAFDPFDADLYVERGKVYEELKKYDLAAQDFTTALQLDPERSYFFYYLRHRQFLNLGYLEKALEDIKHAVDKAPGEYGYQKHLANVYLKLGQIDNAIMAIRKGIEKYPKSSHAYSDSAEFFEGIGYLKEALGSITAAINLEPEKHFYYHDRVRIYIKMGLFDDALRDCNFCIKKNPKEWTHFGVRSEVYRAMGETRLADIDYYESMNLNPCINR